jgi:hypothetical protein
MEQVRAVVPLGRVGRPAAWHVVAVGKQQAQQLARWQAGEVADRAHAGAQGGAVLGQLQRSQLPVDP